MTTPRVSRTKGLIVIGVFTGALASLAASAHAATESVVYSFENNGKDGLLPATNLVEVNGMLYGTTSAGGTGRCENGCGTIFSVNAATSAETVLYSFASAQRGSGPGSLHWAGKLFGTTQGGGHRDAGMLFSFNPNSNVFRQRYYFCNLYNCSDGEEPNSGLIDSKGTLYGTAYGGTYNSGVVFSFDRKTSTETVLYAFWQPAGRWI